MSWVEKEDDEEWKGEPEDINEEALRFAESAANTISERDFLVLQLMACDFDLYEIVKTVERSIDDVRGSVERVTEMVRANFGELDEDGLSETLAAMSVVGHRKPCPRCKDPLCVDDAFCMECGVRNPHFHLRVFKILWQNSYANERRQECEAGHPRSKELGSTCFCPLCGIDLEPITTKRPQ